MKRITLCVISTLLFTSLAFSQQIEKRILALNDQNQTLVCSFTEKKVMPKLKKEVSKHGKLYFKNPDGLAMRYDDPEGDYSVIKDGKFYTKRGQKAVKFSMKDSDSPMAHLRNTLLLSLRGDVQGVAKENDAKLTATESGTRFVILIERKKPLKVGVNKLELVYDKLKGSLLILKMIEANGNTVTYETQDAVARQPIPEEVWEVEK